jgi:hypothetical protein
MEIDHHLEPILAHDWCHHPPYLVRCSLVTDGHHNWSSNDRKVPPAKACSLVRRGSRTGPVQSGAGGRRIRFYSAATDESLSGERALRLLLQVCSCLSYGRYAWGTRATRNWNGSNDNWLLCSEQSTLSWCDEDQ